MTRNASGAKAARSPALTARRSTLKKGGIIAKCDSCRPLREAGLNPVCVDACPMRAIEFGDMDELRQKHGDDLVSELSFIPSSDLTHPNLLIKAKDAVKEGDFHEVAI